MKRCYRTDKKRNAVKKLLAAFMSLVITVLLFPFCSYAEEAQMELDAVSAILVEASTGQVFFEKNADAPLPPASVTKVMTLLLVMEAVDSGAVSLDDTVQASEHAASMGGSQIYLKVGETMTVSDLIKSVVVSSANDAAVALAEHVCGSEEAFVAKMNERAAELGMKNAHFENTNGLDDTTDSHLCSARDIAIMSCELIKHEKILEYSSIWMDSIRNGEFGLTNTNKLIRFFSGANGLKTGYTTKAKYCISAAAKRGGMQLIAVIMASPTSEVRNECAKKLLEYGFANYAKYENPGQRIEGFPVKGGTLPSVSLSYEDFGAVLPKASAGNVTSELLLPEYLCAPVKSGDTVGEMIFRSEDKEIGRIPVKAEEDIPRIGYFELLRRLFRRSILIK